MENVALGREVAVSRHLADGEEFQVSLAQLIAHGNLLMSAVWTADDGGGRPLTKGTGAPLSDPHSPLVFPRNFNRISSPEANSCAGCHNVPFGIPGGGGDIVANVFVLGQRFDFFTSNHEDPVITGGAIDESGRFPIMQTVANSRNTLGMFGSGYIEMLARQMTTDLQAIRDMIPAGGSATLKTKGVEFGVLARKSDGAWDVSRVEGLATLSLRSSGPDAPPSLIIRPFHQAGAVISLREFTNNAMNHHHGIQSTERFGKDTDPDGDGFTNELTRADVTALTVMQATMPVPGRRIPRHPVIEEAVRNGEELFVSLGCVSCHRPKLPLADKGWVFVEPNPFNPVGNLRPGDAPDLQVDLNDATLPAPRLKKRGNVTWVPAFTDLKLHDVTCGPGDPNREPLNMHEPAGSPAFFAGNSRFLTRKLWGTANEPPYYHHGMYTTLRQAVLAHCGEAMASRQAFEALSDYGRNSIIEFLKTLQVLPPGTTSLVIDENGKPRHWREFPWQ
jgi:hypothetical protein